MSRPMNVALMTWAATLAFLCSYDRVPSAESGPRGRSSSSDLIGHWSFDAPLGSAAKDRPAVRQAAKVHGAQRTDGVQGRALQFDGRDDYIALGDFGTRRAVTIAFWMKAEDIARSDDWQGLVSSDAWQRGVLHIGVRDR
ncbi:MAG: hypothetical protein GXP27_03800, partial [Planctomycetes bacterium]|nr:hypothetical protein [Planctomycetota bacterium]